MKALDIGRLKSRALSVLVVAALGLAGATISTVAAPPTAHASTAGGQITRSEVLQRARHWYAQDPPRYDGSDTSQWLADIEGDHRYRRDCSGLVSMALHLTSSPSSFHLSTSTYGVPINWRDLRPGDYLTVDDGVVGDWKDGHVILFEGWAPAYPKFNYYGFGGTDGQRNSLRHRIGDFSGAAVTTEYSDDGTNGAGKLDGHPTSKYKAFRYKNIVDGGSSGLGDISGDGRPDILGVSYTGELHRWYGDGAGGFGHAGPVGPGWDEYAVVAPGDINSDGRADLVGVSSSTGALHRWYGDGSGGFAYAGVVGSGWDSYYVNAVGDINSDGRNDLLGLHTSTGALHTWYGDGAGGFAYAGSGNGSGWDSYDVTAPGDISGDGRPDLVGVNWSTGELHRWYGNGAGGFGYAGVVGGGWDSYRVATAGDINSDGRNDLIAVAIGTGVLHRWYGDGSGGFAHAGSVGGGWNSYRIVNS